jgi:hypothetical protein
VDNWWESAKPDVEIIEEKGSVIGYSVGRPAEGGRVEFFEEVARKWFVAGIRFVKGVKQTISGGTIYPDQDDAERILKQEDITKTARIFAVVRPEKLEAA